MPFVGAIFAALKFFAGTKTGRILGLVLLVSAAFGVWTWRVYERGYHSATSKIEQKTAAESKRRVGVLAQNHALSETIAARLKSTGDNNVSVERDFNQAIAGVSGVCLDVGLYGRLRDASGRASSGGVEKPAR